MEGKIKPCNEKYATSLSPMESAVGNAGCKHEENWEYRETRKSGCYASMQL